MGTRDAAETAIILPQGDYILMRESQVVNKISEMHSIYVLISVMGKVS